MILCSPTSPAFYGGSTGPRSMTAADIAHEWTQMYNCAKDRAAKSGKSIPSTLALFQQSLKCHYCGKQGCFSRVCPAKLRGDPPVARPRPSPIEAFSKIPTPGAWSRRTRRAYATRPERGPYPASRAADDKLTPKSDGEIYQKGRF